MKSTEAWWVDKVMASLTLLSLPRMQLRPQPPPLSYTPITHELSHLDAESAANRPELHICKNGTCEYMQIGRCISISYPQGRESRAMPRRGETRHRSSHCGHLQLSISPRIISCGNQALVPKARWHGDRSKVAEPHAVPVRRTFRPPAKTSHLFQGGTWTQQFHSFSVTFHAELSCNNYIGRKRWLCVGKSCTSSVPTKGLHVGVFSGRKVINAH